MSKIIGEKVMTWNQQGKWWIENSSVVIPVSAWKPYENIDQALAILKKFDLWEIYKGMGAYSVTIFISRKPVIVVTDVDLCRAICRAALLAVMEV